VSVHSSGMFTVFHPACRGLLNSSPMAAVVYFASGPVDHFVFSIVQELRRCIKATQREYMHVNLHISAETFLLARGHSWACSWTSAVNICALFSISELILLF